LPRGSSLKKWHARIESNNLGALVPRPILGLAFALVAALYLFDLSNGPVYFGGDEAHFAVGGHALAKTGRNLRGDLLPVFVNLADPSGGPPESWGDTYYHPYLFYLEALVMTVAPLSIATARLPVALIAGLITPLLLYAVALRMIGRQLPALIAALVLALAPMQVILGRQALDYVLPVPFVLGWLWFLDVSLETRQPKHEALAGLILGVGCYSYIASWAVMPMLLALSWLVWMRAGHGRRSVMLSAVAFAMPLLIAPLWIAVHPEMIRQTIARYTAPDSPRAPFGLTLLSLVKPLLWFVRGGPSLTTATARSGVVLLPVAAFLAAGCGVLAGRRDWRALVIAAGVLISLLPAALKGEPGMIQRAAYALPFVALASAFGFAWLWQQAIGRVAALLLIAASLVQFSYFYFDYFTHYQLRSAFYYDPVAFREIADQIVRSPTAPIYYFDTDVDDAATKWRFYLTVDGRTELLTRTRYIAPDARPAGPAGSLLVTLDATARIAALVDDGWKVETVIKDVDDRRAAVILRKS
jgi:4-amino-4-deoxy-L-arabinose transferase-like glycosyltransferase